MESAIDECARVAGVDALQFRLAHCEDARLRRVFERVASAAEWPAKRQSEARVLREARVAMSAKLLATGDDTLAEVGYRSGFADQAHFQREFRTATAMTPGEYRSAFRSHR